MNLTQGLASRKISTRRIRENRANDADSDRADQPTEKVIVDIDASDRSSRLSSVIFPEDCEFFDEIDDVVPDGGEDIYADPSFFLPPRQSSRLTRASLYIEKDHDMPPVDWSSLLKSCNLAKNGLRDSYSEQMVVTNMFMSNLAPLTSALNFYSLMCCEQPNPSDCQFSIDDIKACTTEARRALRFAMACLTPTRFEVNGDGQERDPTSSHTFNGEEIYNITRPYRQNLQMAAVRGSTLGSHPFTEDDDISSKGEVHHHYDLHTLLARIINSGRPASLDDSSLASDSQRTDILSTIEEGHRKIRILAARLLCNIVTDNQIAAGIVLRDLPLSPTPDLVESRIVGSITGSSDRNSMLFWSDLVSSTAKVHGVEKVSYGNYSGDREALAAVAAALHNLLTSLEGLSSTAKHHPDLPLDIPPSERNSNKVKAECGPMIPSNMGFEMASDGILLNSLLRNILPTKAVLMQSQFEKEEAKPSRPKFRPPAVAEENLSDSATEWISYILERLASRGLLLNMLHSVGGTTTKSVTPEQVVLVSCIRQAVDEYHHHAITSEPRKKSSRRSSSGIKMLMSVNPLWGRSDEGANGKLKPESYSRIAVPVLLSLANEIEEFRLQLNALREDRSLAMYDGEESCTTQIIDDLSDILAQSLGDHIVPSLTNNEDFIADARSVIGRETSLIPSCCRELGRILDMAMAYNIGKKAREMHLSSQQQRTAIMMVRLMANIVYQCRYNQDLLRTTPIPVLKVEMANIESTSSNAASSNYEIPVQRTGLHVLLSTTTLSPACFTLREWCIVAIRNAVEGNAANTETIRSLEANQALSDTPELRQMGIKIDIDSKGKVIINRESQSSFPSDSDQVSWA